MRDFRTLTVSDPFHWWRSRPAESFRMPHFRLLAHLLARHSLIRHEWSAALEGGLSEVVSLLPGRANVPADRDLLMTCVLRNALVGQSAARRLLIQNLRSRGLNDLATSWRLAPRGAVASWRGQISLNATINPTPSSVPRRLGARCGKRCEVRS